MLIYRARKIGTQPWLIVCKPGWRIPLGQRIWCRKHDAQPGRWTTGVVTKVNSDGYLFCRTDVITKNLNRFDNLSPAGQRIVVWTTALFLGLPCALLSAIILS